MVVAVEPLPTEFDLQARRPRWTGGAFQVMGDAGRYRLTVLVEQIGLGHPDTEHAGAAIGRDHEVGRRAPRPISHLGAKRGDRGRHDRIIEAGVMVDDDVGGVTADGGEVPGQELVRSIAVGPLEPASVGEARTERTGEHAQEGEAHEPHRQGATGASVGRGCESLDHACHRRAELRPARSGALADR